MTQYTQIKSNIIDDQVADLNATLATANKSFSYRFNGTHIVHIDANGHEYNAFFGTERDTIAWLNGALELALKF